LGGQINVRDANKKPTERQSGIPRRSSRIRVIITECHGSSGRVQTQMTVALIG
jgi:hypothetical protein